MKYELSVLAITDLDSIWEYTAKHWSVEQANKYYKLIFDTIDSITIEPYMGRSIKEVKKDHRMMLVKSHLIIYKIERSTIYIDRILHQDVDINGHFLNKLI